MSRHSKLTEELATNYKQKAINDALIEMYAGGERYIGKHSSLIEKSLLKHEEWTSMRDNYKEKVE